MCKAHTWPMLVRGDKRLFAQRQRRDHKMTKHRLVYIYIYRLKWTSRSSMHYRCSTRWSNLSQGSHMENKKQHANFPALQGLTHSGDTHLDNRSEVLSKQKKTYARNAGTRENTLQRYETNALQRTAPSKLLKRGQRLLDTHH